MYELDHMLNGKQSSQHHQELIKQAKYAHMVQQIKPAQTQRKAVSPLRAILVTIAHLIGR